MTALPPEERPPGRSEPLGSPALSGGSPVSRQPGCPSDEVFELLANLVAFQASVEGHELRRPPRGHPVRARRWRREHQVLLLQRQMLKLRVDALPSAAYAPFPRPCVDRARNS
ncbi:MAG TPA: hypothetical protein VLR26_06915 [Frankiaceae bacterium]|nr:hypothetical protein [Frankiaceae bacterium]